MERDPVEKVGSMSFTRPVFPSCLPLPCFFSGTSGTLGKNSAVSLAVTGFDLSHSGWDTGPFSVGQVGHFVPVAPSCAVQRKMAGEHPARFRPPECVNFGAKPVPLAATIRGVFESRYGNNEQSARDECPASGHYEAQRPGYRERAVSFAGSRFGRRKAGIPCRPDPCESSDGRT